MLTLNESRLPVLADSAPDPSPGASRGPYRVVLHGLRHFCGKLPSLVGSEQWDIRDRSIHSASQLTRLVAELPSADLVFTWGGRIDMGPFLHAAKSLGVRKLVMFWCGSDVLRAQKFAAAGKLSPWIAARTHWAASPALAEEVRALGIQCEFVQASFVAPVAQPLPLPRDFSVMVFLPRADAVELYGWDRVVAAARALPHLKFKLVGLHEGQLLEVPSNVEIQRWTSNLAPLYEQSTVLWRPVRHDAGISFMVLEALAHARHVLYTYSVPGAIQVHGVDDAVAQLQHLHALHQAGVLGINHAGPEIIARVYARDIVRDELRRRWEQLIRS